MKPQTNSPNALSRIIMLATLLIFSSCTSRQDTKSDSAFVVQVVMRPSLIDIHTAVLTNNAEALKQHVAAGTNLNEKDPYGGSSPLITAAIFGKSEMARILIDAGADINFQNNDGSTPMHAASFFCRPEIVKMLLDKGADKTIKNKYGSTAYESVAGNFSDVKGTYDMMGKMLGPMGLKLDYSYVEKTRPEIAAMLK